MTWMNNSDLSKEYRLEFIRAVARTESLGLSAGEIILENDICYLSGNSKYNINQLVEWNYKRVKDRTQLAECIRVHYYMLPLIREFISQEAYITIGDVIDGGTPTYGTNQEYLNSILSHPQIKDKIKVHVWITLSSSEIIDLTIIRGMYVGKPEFELYENMYVIGRDIHDLGLVYKPMIVGTDFLVKTKSLIHFQDESADALEYPKFNFL